MADDATAERHTGWRQGLLHGFGEAMALVQDLPPQASAADALKVLADHYEVWQWIAGVTPQRGPEQEG